MNKIIFAAFILLFGSLMVYYTGFYHEDGYISTWEAFKVEVTYPGYLANCIVATIILIVGGVYGYKALLNNDKIIFGSEETMKLVMLAFCFVILFYIWFIGPNNMSGNTTIEQAQRGVYIR